jgi:hypothetical protein
MSSVASRISRSRGSRQPRSPHHPMGGFLV